MVGQKSVILIWQQVKHMALKACSVCFAEGLTVTDDGIWQITWREQMALLRDAKTLAIKKDRTLFGWKAGVWLMTNGKSFMAF